MTIPTPTEDQEQSALFMWAAYQRGKYPELDLLYHIPNGGKRNIVTAAKLKAQGVKAGVPDLFLPVARNGCHGLYIEMKRIRGGKLSPQQTSWMDALQRQGYAVAVCKGAEEAQSVILNYLRKTGE